jgi:hypothetical protein
MLVRTGLASDVSGVAALFAIATAAGAAASTAAATLMTVMVVDSGAAGGGGTAFMLLGMGGLAAERMPPALAVAAAARPRILRGLSASVTSASLTRPRCTGRFIAASLGRPRNSSPARTTGKVSVTPRGHAREAHIVQPHASTSPFSGSAQKLPPRRASYARYSKRKQRPAIENTSPWARQTGDVTGTSFIRVGFVRDSLISHTCKAGSTVVGSA